MHLLINSRYNNGTSGTKWEKVGEMFFGNYEHTLDEKGRLVIPRKMRGECGPKVYILKGFDGALSIYKGITFEKMVKSLEELPFSKKDARAYQRIQLASACELDVDKAGRVQIPTQLLVRYEIGKDVMVLGVGDHIEVWNKDAYLRYEKEMNDKFESIAETITDKDE